MNVAADESVCRLSFLTPQMRVDTGAQLGKAERFLCNHQRRAPVLVQARRLRSWLSETGSDSPLPF